MFNFKKKKISLEDTFAAGRKFLSHVKESSRAAFSTATLVINVLPWDPAHHPSGEGVPSHFSPSSSFSRKCSTSFRRRLWS